MNDKLFSEITAIVNRIRELELQLGENRRALRDKTALWTKGDAATGPAEKPKKAPRRRGTTEQVNISAAVLALVNRQTGLNVPQIMDKLGFRGHEAAVRSALKKAKDSTITSVDGRWYPIAPNPPVAPQKEKARTEESPRPGPVAGYNEFGASLD